LVKTGSVLWDTRTVGKVSKGEKFAVALFLLTSIQAAFLQPNVTLIPGERAKLFTGLLCALTLAACILFVKRPSRCGSVKEVAISVILGILILISSLLSSTVLSSSFRGFVVAASALGGFWCARILLASPARQALFTRLCTVLLAGIIALSLLGYTLYGNIFQFLDVNLHPISCRILLLFFAPIVLILGGGRSKIILGISLICLSYAVFLLSNLRSAALIPIILGVVAVILGNLRLKHFVALLIPLALLLVLFFYSLPSVKIGREFEPAYYRVENYPFSLHIALKHPFFGIGLRAPRVTYLEDYEIKYPYVTREKFAASLEHIVTSENTFLNFMVDLGFPFLIIYTGSIAIIVFRLIRLARKPDPGSFLPPLALLLPITAGLLYFQVLDGLLHPQISWFFHILLGLVPVSENSGSILSEKAVPLSASPSDIDHPTVRVRI
jgi:hypothetical protein